MNKAFEALATPAVVVDLDVVKRNIAKMADDARACGLAHRPHIKTHRCSELARMQMEAGCCGVTVAKLGEAETMVDGGIRDIFVAYPIIGEDKIARLLALSRRCRILSAVNSVQGARALSEAFAAAGLRAEVLIEVDGGLNRGGVKPMQPTLDFALSINALEGLNIRGLMYYGGLVYDSHNADEIRSFAHRERDELLGTAGLLREHGFCMDVLSAGSSFTGKLPEDLRGITEIRSGHYIFNDCGQLDVGLATPEDCALSVITTIIAKPDAHTVIADVGTKSLTSDGCHHRKGYGYVRDYPQVEVYSLNEEHAFMRTEGENPLQIGQKVALIPNHACVVTNLVDRAYGFSNGVFDRMLMIDARGKSV